ncbi:hypothetical protein I0E51_16130 [Pseudomonas lalucatii]|nr:hypothetical protein [Pseudomonas lalucatii]
MQAVVAELGEAVAEQAPWLALQQAAQGAVDGQQARLGVEQRQALGAWSKAWRNCR